MLITTVSELLTHYQFYAMTLNYIEVNEENREVTLNMDYFFDNKKNLHIDDAINCELIFHNCFFWRLEGDISLLEAKNKNIDGTFLVSEILENNTSLEELRFFIEVDHYEPRNQYYLTMNIIPESITLTQN